MSKNIEIIDEIKARGEGDNIIHRSKGEYATTYDADDFEDDEIPNMRAVRTAVGDSGFTETLFFDATTALPIILNYEDHLEAGAWPDIIITLQDVTPTDPDNPIGKDISVSATIYRGLNYPQGGLSIDVDNTGDGQTEHAIIIILKR